MRSNAFDIQYIRLTSIQTKVHGLLVLFLSKRLYGLSEYEKGAIRCKNLCGVMARSVNLKPNLSFARYWFCKALAGIFPTIFIYPQVYRRSDEANKQLCVFQRAS